MGVTDPDNGQQNRESFCAGRIFPLRYTVNNAGYLPRFLPITESDPEDWWKSWEVKVKGVFLLTRQMLPIMLRDQQSDRTIVTLASTSAHGVSSGESSY